MTNNKHQVTREETGTWETQESKDERWIMRKLTQRAEARGQKSQATVNAPTPSKRSIFLLIPALLTLAWDYLYPRVVKNYSSVLTVFSSEYRRVQVRVTTLRNRISRFRQELGRRATLLLTLPLVGAKALWRRIRPPLSSVYLSVQKGLVFVNRELQVMKREYDRLLSVSDAKLDAAGAAVDRALEDVRFSAEGFERRMDVQFRGSTAWIKKKRFLRRAERWGFVVLRPEVFRNLPDSEILFLLDQLHQRLTPFKLISLLEKTQEGVTRNAEWCRSEFDRTRADWDIYATNATLDPDAWLEAFEWLVAEIGRQHLAWHDYIVFPIDQIPKTFWNRLLEEVENEDDLFVNRVEYEKLLYKLFHPLCDTEPADLFAFEEYQRRLFRDERLWDVLAPEITSVEPWGIQTSSGAWMLTIKLHSLGSDIVSYTPEAKSGEKGKEVKATVIRDVEWLKQQLTQVLLVDSSRDQQIWLESAVIGAPHLGRFMSALKRHLRTIDAWSEQDRQAHPDPIRMYAEVTKSFWDEAEANPASTLGFQQGYTMVLKAGSWESLLALRDRVTQVLGLRRVFYDQAVAEYQQWQGMRQMLPVIWEDEVEENYEIPRTSMPMTMQDLKSVFKVPRVEISPVGGILGMFANGELIVMGPGNYGILGTTEVGKSVIEKETALMTVPLAIAETECFIVDIRGSKPGSETGGWQEDAQLLGGDVIYPSLYKTPGEMREDLDSRLDTLVFLYNPDEDLDDEGVAWDMEFLKFVLARTEMRREQVMLNPQLVLPPFEELGIRQFDPLSPPRKKIRRRLFILDEFEAWWQKPNDKRAAFVANRIMSQARSRDMSCLYTAKSMESVRQINPLVWSSLKHITDKGWVLLYTPDAQSVPENITYPRTTPEEAQRADLIVEYIKDIRRLGGMTRVEETYGRIVWATGDFVSPGQAIVPPQLHGAIKRKKEESEWGG